MKARGFALALLLVACRPPRTDASLPRPDAPRECAGCHAPQARSLEESRKFIGRANPLYAAGLARAEKAAPDAAQGCGRCHVEGSSSVTTRCMACHGLEKGGMQATRGPPEVVFSRRASEKCAYPVRAGAAFETAALCATCHASSHGPSGGAYDGWRVTQYPQRGMYCSECHMERRKENPDGHLFPGTDPWWMDLGLDLQVETISGGLLEVVIENVGAGHPVPAEACELRELVLEAVFEGKGGAPLGKKQLARFGCERRDRSGRRVLHFEPGAKSREERLEPEVEKRLPVTPPEGWRTARVRWSYHPLAPELAGTVAPDLRINPRVFGEVVLSQE
ncbi:MAG: hypothetical protein HYZ28_05565 [Myxococcales bacterium]|nr:hypothetical protein [Myxococcales bacterium]